MTEQISKPALEIATEYVQRGWNPLPIPRGAKRPHDSGWPSRIVDESKLAELFQDTDQNIGVVLGPSSGGLTDVDLDCPEAIKLAPYFLSETDAIFGRLSKPNSHWLYTTKLSESCDKAVLKFIDPTNNEMIVELRIGGSKGAQTVFPGSTHGIGELIEWAKAGDPARVDGSDLCSRVARLASAALLGRHWPVVGSRHTAALVIGGFLARAGWEEEDIGPFVQGIVVVAGDEEPDDRCRAACDAARAFKTGGNAYGLTALTEIFGAKCASKVAEWIGDQERESLGASADPASTPVPSADMATPFRWCDPSCIPARRWVYGHHYIQGFITTTSAPGGVGKSSLGIVEALSIATGRPLLGIEPDLRTNVWIWNGEDTLEELQRRIVAAAMHHQIDPKDLEGHLFVNSGRDTEIIIAKQTKSGTEIQTPVVEALKATIIDNKIGVVIIDPFVSSH